MGEMTHKRLLDALHYDMVAGVFRWNKCRVRSFDGRPAGVYRDDGYVYIKVFGRSYKAHRLAWFYHHGRWPSECIDHIDGNGFNNSIANLRECSHSQNMKNVKLRSDNRTGIKGVGLHQGKYRARIMVDGKALSLGHYNTQSEAQSAYASAAEKLHGAFARLQ